MGSNGLFLYNIASNNKQTKNSFYFNIINKLFINNINQFLFKTIFLDFD